MLMELRATDRMARTGTRLIAGHVVLKRRASQSDVDRAVSRVTFSGYCLRPSALGAQVCAFIQAITSRSEYRMDRPTRMNGGPTCRCRHACKVRGENDVISANSRSVRIRSPGCVIRSSVD